MKSASFHFGILACWLVAAATAAGQSFTTPVRVSWVGDARTTAAVTWDRQAAGRGKVQYGLTTSYTDTAMDGGGTYRHVVHLSGLTANTRYYYEASSSDGYLQEGTFRTAPEAGDPMSFVFHGDLQGGLNEPGAQGVSDQIVLEDPSFILNLGDMADERYGVSGFATWEPFFRVCSNELSRAVFMPLMGNHDAMSGGNTTRALYHRMFTLPEPSLGSAVYAFTAGNARYIILNTEESASAQSAWLSRELQAAVNDPEITWIFALCHRPPYSWGERAGWDDAKDNWAPILTMYEVDFMVSGHSHNYQRSVPIRGVRYLVSGGGGGSLYDSAVDHESHAFATTCYNYVSADITNDVMSLRAIRSDGRIFDTATITSRRQVRVEPAFPLPGEPATIFYRATEGPLSGANPVYIHLGQDDFSSVFSDAPMTWNASIDRWEYQFTVPSSATQRLAFVFRDGGGVTTNWHNNYDYNWQALLGRVELSPSTPAAGSSAVLRYAADMGPLSGATTVSAWPAFDGQPFSGENQLVMSNTSGSEWETTVSIPPSAGELTVAFSADTGWDDDDRRNWVFPVTGATVQAYAPEPVVAQASPIVTDSPPAGSGERNNIGDNFDLAQVGPSLRTQVGPYGFGGWGSIWVNQDATNLYLGGYGVDMAGSNNVMVLFLGVDTLSDNAWNLWHKDFVPNALNFLHNVRFTEPMDIAIVLGDQYGDGNAFTNFEYGGADFGQGLFYLGTDTSEFVPVTGARLSQFDGEGTTPCATSWDSPHRQTLRWEAAIPWSSLGAASSTSAVNLFVCGVFGSSSVSTNDRYLSRSTLGERAWGGQDAYGQYAYSTINVRPQRVNLPHGDRVGDGLSNEWRQEYFGTPGGPPADADSDGDGQTNREEEVGGTDPTDADSLFGFEEDSSRSRFRWPHVEGRLYDVYATASLTNAFELSVPGLATNVYTPTTAGFYRVKARK